MTTNWSLPARSLAEYERTAATFEADAWMIGRGGKINGSFLAADLIDELSVLIAPIADGGIGTPSLFDAKEGRGLARHLELVSVERCAGDLVWLRYRRAR